jgi:non-ribosomal peptide synthetase component F
MLEPWQNPSPVFGTETTSGAVLKSSLPDQGCTHEAFAAQAHARPDSPALIYSARTLTYGELDRQANGVAWLLRDLGVGSSVPVAVCVERSADMVVGLLGVLKAGGVYKGFDPEYPGERTRSVLGVTGAPVVLTTRTLAQGRKNGQAGILLLDERCNSRLGRPIIGCQRGQGALVIEEGAPGRRRSLGSGSRRARSSTATT